MVTCVSDGGSWVEEVSGASLEDGGSEEGVKVEKDVTVDTEGGGVKVDVVGTSELVSLLEVEDVVGVDDVELLSF